MHAGSTIIPVACLTDLTTSDKKGLDKEGVQKIRQLGLDALSQLIHVNYELKM